ncbi:RrF2 family transcriptional regulator [Egibacter rhizosphaerae]|nr:Rrf2 family transcriptional regulator [Egibacter rhizosphaerae]
MQIRLGRRADYAIRAVLHIARRHGERAKAREIAEAMHVPETFLPQILAALVRAELVTSVAGPDGGYALATEPERVSMLDVVTAVEGEVRSTDCVLRGGPCRWEDRCAVHEPWARAQQALLDQLGATTFAELREADELLEAERVV